MMTGTAMTMANNGNNHSHNNSVSVVAPRSRTNSISYRYGPPISPGPSPHRHMSPNVRRSSRSGSIHLASPPLTSASALLITQSPSSRPFLSPESHVSSVIMSMSTTPTAAGTPFIPNLADICPPHNPTVEAALDTERSRIKEREKEEKDMDSAQLRVALKRERTHSLRLASDLATFKSLSVKSQAEAEAHEEGIINGLLRRLECLQREKGRIIVELEREEEMLTNTLQKKLNEVRREKALLQKQIEREHSSNATLKTQLSAITLTDMDTTPA